jgi:hypothetical protein
LGNFLIHKETPMPFFLHQQALRALAILFALIAFLSAPAANSQTLQEVIGTSEVLDTASLNTFTDTFLQATITPTDAASVLEFDVIIPSADARRTSGSPQERAFQMRLWNVTDNTEAIPAHVYGIQLAAGSSAAQSFWQPVYMEGRVNAGSTATRTYRVQMRAVFGTGGAEARLRADEERATLIVREITPINPAVFVNPEPIIDIGNWPQTWAGSVGHVTWPNFEYDEQSGEYSIVYTLQNYGPGKDQLAIGHDTATSLSGFSSTSIIEQDLKGWLVGWEPDGNGGCIGAAYILDAARRGMTVVNSNDCESITSIAAAPTFTDDETSPVTSAYGVGDVNRIWKSEIDGDFYCFCRWFTGPTGPQSPSLSGHGRGVRAVALYRFDGGDMTDGDDWTHLGPVFWPDAHDGGITEFYGATAPILVSGRLVSFVRVLRDDVAAGIGWSEIAVSDDGITWHRERWPFVQRGSGGDWDKAIKWIADVEVVGSDLVGITMDYDEGHKVGGRVIGMFTVPMADVAALVARLP